MLVAVLFVAGLLLFAVCCKPEKSWRRALLEAMTLWGATLAVTTELLNAVGHICKPHVALAWGAMSFGCGCVLLLRGWRGRIAFRLPSLKGLHWTEWLSLAAIVVLLVLTGVAALVSPPNAWDVMEYHMPRVVQWIQRGSLAYYPTHDCAQLFYPPFAEWVILHLHLLAGSDRFSNLVQWFSFVGCIVAASYASETLGAKRLGQWIAALLAATLPLALLAASGAKNDLVLAFWLLVAGVFALDLGRKRGMSNALLVGLASGLALLTKGTAFLLCPPLLAGCLLPCLRARRPAQLASWLLIPMLAVTLNGGHFLRNVHFAGSPLGLSSPNGDGEQSLRIKKVSPRGAAANLIRNVSLHLGTDNMRFNRRTQSFLRASISLLGIDPDDKDATRAPFAINPYTYNEYFAGSPLHFLLFCLSMGWIALGWRKLSLELVAFVLGIVGAWIMFSAFIPWWPTSARLHTAPLMFSAAALGVLLERAWRPLTSFFLICACVVALKTVLKNPFRPLVTLRGTSSIFATERWPQYFAENPWRIRPYPALVAALKAGPCRELGVDISAGEPFEYPLLWALGAARGDFRVWDVGMNNPSARLAGSFEAKAACAVLCIDCIENQEKLAKYGATLPLHRNFGRQVLFTLPMPSQALPATR